MTSIASTPSPYTSSSPTSTTSTTPTASPPHKRPRVSAEHTLSRVRENQRRHRARRKDYIATLEQKLADTEAQLAAARAEVEALRRERAAWQCEHNGSGSGSDGGGKQNPNPNSIPRADTAGPSMESELLALARLVDTLPAPPMGDVDVDMFAGIFPAVEMAILPASTAVEEQDDTPLLTTGPPPCCTDVAPAPSPLPAPPSPECAACHTRPAPLPTESTTLCAQAYVLIAQQNFRGIDAGTIRLWLWQGYRRARREGEGCRVENGALFRVLDYISGGV